MPSDEKPERSVQNGPDPNRHKLDGGDLFWFDLKNSLRLIEVDSPRDFVGDFDATEDRLFLTFDAHDTWTAAEAHAYFHEHA